MTPGNHVEIIDRDGWRKEFPVDKPLVHLGSDARNDIVLSPAHGEGVAARHVQLLAMPGKPGAYRAINLASTDVPLGREGGRSLAPRSILDLADGEHLQLGEFAVIFHLGEPERAERGSTTNEADPAQRDRRTAVPVTSPAVAPAENQRESAAIGLRVSFPQATVEPDRPLEGIIALRNLGSEPGAQFRLSVEGLDPDFYEIGPGPILFPNVEKGVYLRIRHPCGPEILSGQRQISIEATAPEAYPGESVTVVQVLHFLPFYAHKIRLTAVD
jgi:hypothetical protein